MAANFWDGMSDLNTENAKKRTRTARKKRARRKAGVVPEQAAVETQLDTEIGTRVTRPSGEDEMGTRVTRPSKGNGPAIVVKKSAMEMLLPYQRRLVDDEARFKYALQARQTGKDFASGAEGIRDCFNHEREGGKVTWLIAAPSERQSMESLAKWKEWAAAFKLDIAESFEERSEKNNSESLIKSATIVFPSGSRVIAVPGKPDTVRGFSANILLTEFAFFEQPDATWRAIMPSITNPLRGGQKKCRLVTTPNGMGNKAHELWVRNYQAPDPKWSCHHVDIHEAVAEGLAVNVEDLRGALDDPEGWAQEYELNFLDRSTVLLPYELIVPCENPLATAVCDPEYWNGNGDSWKVGDSYNSSLRGDASLRAPVFCGIDFGRSQDLTVCWSLEMTGGVFRMTKEVLELSKVSTPEQLQMLRPRLRRATRVCLDYTGPGVGLGDLMVDPKEGFGEWNPQQHKYGKVELCRFSNRLKLELFPAVRVAFELKTVGIPCQREIREDLHSVSRVALAGGGVTYKAPHTKDGHADRCTALALAIRATTFDVGSAGSVTFEGTRQSQAVLDRSERSVLG